MLPDFTFCGSTKRGSPEKAVDIANNHCERLCFLLEFSLGKISLDRSASSKKCHPSYFAKNSLHTAKWILKFVHIQKYFCNLLPVLCSRKLIACLKLVEKSTICFRENTTNDSSCRNQKREGWQL